ncbi:monovalent cation:proton antiporter family protein [Pleionea sp. CnH1-48]|uniref:monovalent cation:proton antiporter family protein n=1 Tax=Pleionea sp. CnH1-48 TaxID=2954494 RepID=UPI00209765F5|nr:monovalent cation:proton antiporter family protein [Pleionea sp. CnH1-48]MCO7227166.1 cation:proton antiporter [Pleionea sp. CnH1-48]
MHHIIYAQLLVTLASSVILVALFRRFQLPTILAYIGVGFLLGQMGFEFFAPDSNARYIAEVGVVFMLFSLGLEFSVPRVIALRNQVLGMGILQMVLTTLTFMFIARLFGIDWTLAFIIAAALAMSSTAIITKQLDEQRETHSRHGTMAISTLLFQDMAAVPLLILVPIVAVSDTDMITQSISLAMFKGIVAVIVLMIVGKWLLPRLFHEVASAHSDELFVMTSILVALVASWFTEWLGLSMALGAFLAGMLLAESQFKHQIDTEIRPFRDILLGLFFVTIGTLVNLATLFDHALLILTLLLILISTKMLIVIGISRLMKARWEDSLKASLALSQAGELGFVLIGLARQQDIISEEVTSIILSIGVLSMAITPFLMNYASSISHMLFGSREEARLNSNAKRLIAQAVKEWDQHVIICGFGRIGQTIKRFLDNEGIPTLALDRDPRRVREGATAGEDIYFGDARRRSILNAAGLERAQLIIITFDELDGVLESLAAIRQNRKNVSVLVRTKDDRNLEQLQQAGATEVVPESLEAALMLVSHVMFVLKVPMREIIDKVQAVRQNRYQLLHSFYHGESSDLMRVLETHREQLHAVVLTERATATNSTVQDLSFPKSKVHIKAVKRGKESFTTLTPDFTFQQGDIVLLSGDPDYIELAENVLLGG